MIVSYRKIAGILDHIADRTLDDFMPTQNCPSAKKFYQGGTNWFALVIFTLALFSTIFSGIFLFIAVTAPRWGRAIHSGGKLTASSATVLTTLFAKLIELSFVAVFVTFLGQVLSRRAISNTGRGITLAELNMRAWIMQPGTLITHYETVQVAALTFLGAVSLTTALMAMMYTTAAQALGMFRFYPGPCPLTDNYAVTPMLKLDNWENGLMYGVVKTTFANPVYIASSCKTPIQVLQWDDNYSESLVGSSCLQIDHAAQGYHNYQQYLGFWADLVSSGNGTTDQILRPPGFGLFLQNTTVNGSWVEISDTKAQSAKFNRVINNVTLAMPHAGIFAAARDPMNHIMQPEELDNAGMYNIQAALPAPYINVICANVNRDELAPMMYEAMPNVTLPLNYTADLPTAFTTKVDWGNFTKMKTAIDDVFGWDNYWRPPIFYKYPVNFNTILNQTGDWPRNAVYLLGKGGPEQLTENDFFMCQIKAGLYPNCSTRYTASGSGGSMASHCDDPNDDMAYIRGNKSRIMTVSSDWFNVASDTMNALSLNNGVTDGDASNARILTQLMLTKKELNPSLPSPAEALAVMTGCSLLMSAVDSPFVEFWVSTSIFNPRNAKNADHNENYSSVTLNPGEYQAFNASKQTQQYASGGTQSYQRIFYVVLFFVFLTNVFVIVYMLVYRGLVTDFSDPPNLFSIAVNSPPNELLAGSCGGGPESEQYRVNWKVECEDQHLFMAGEAPPSYGSTGKSGGGFSALRKRPPHLHGISRDEPGADDVELATRGDRDAVESRRGSRMSVSSPPGDNLLEPPGGLHNRETPIGRMYSKLSKHRSFI